MYHLAPSTIQRQEPSVPRMQVVTTLTKPASLPPMVMVTRVVLGLRLPSWLLRTSSVLAPLHAAKVKLATVWPATQSGAYARGVREQLPGSYPSAPTPDEYESPRA